MWTGKVEFGRFSGVRRWAAGLAVLAGVVAAAPCPQAEVQFQAYGGINGNFSSDVTVRKPGVVTDSRSIEWEGKPFEMPPYWGVRGIYWLDRNPDWGVAIEYTHSKAYADLGGRRWRRLRPRSSSPTATTSSRRTCCIVSIPGSTCGASGRTPAFGVGLAIPHVEVISRRRSRSADVRVPARRFRRAGAGRFRDAVTRAGPASSRPRSAIRHQRRSQRRWHTSRPICGLRTSRSAWPIASEAAAAPRLAPRRSQLDRFQLE